MFRVIKKWRFILFARFSLEQVFLSLTRKPVPPIEKEKLVFVLLQLMINVCFNNTFHLLPPQQIKSTIIIGSSKQVRWACKYVSYSIYIFTHGYIIYKSINCKNWFLLIKPVDLYMFRLCIYMHLTAYSSF